MNQITILNVRVSKLTLNQAIEQTGRLLTDGKQHQVVTPNPEFIVAAQSDPTFQTILNSADLSLADGVGLLLAARFRGQQLHRVTGVDYTLALCALAAQSGEKVFLFGGEQTVAETASQNLQKQFPGLLIVGALSGMPVEVGKTDSVVLTAIQHSGATILLVALGQVKQEKWIAANLTNLQTVKLAIGVGGTLDYLAGRVPRSPKWLRAIGLEWLFRLIRQPKRWKRILTATIVFPFLVLKKGART